MEEETAPKDERDLTSRVVGLVGRLFRSSDVEYAIPFLVTLAGCHGFFWFSAQLAESYTGNWWVERHPLPPISLTSCAPGIAENVCERLLDQWALATSRAEHHFWITRFYTIRHFAFLATAFATGTAAGAALSAIAKAGWDHVDVRVRGVFLGLACGTAFFGGFPSLTLLQKNVEDNAVAYDRYDDVSEEIRTYVATGSSPRTSDPLLFVHYADRILSELNSIHISFDETAIDAGRKRFKDASTEPENDR